jgi:hypothetical protein
LFKNEGRLDKALAQLAGVERAARGDGVALPTRMAPPEGFTPIQGEQGFQLAFLIRMVFSCLIDADRSAAAAFDANFETSSPPPPPAPISALRAELQGWMARRTPPTTRSTTSGTTFYGTPPPWPTCQKACSPSPCPPAPDALKGKLPGVDVSSLLARRARLGRA